MFWTFGLTIVTLLDGNLYTHNLGSGIIQMHEKLCVLTDLETDYHIIIIHSNDNTCSQEHTFGEGESWIADYKCNTTGCSKIY